jgi:septal ring factor EnvC (AmiA/AmiB activator)
MKEKTDKLSKDFEKLRKERKEDASIRTSMADEIKKIETKNVKMKEKLVDMQCRTMKYNLIFTGLMSKLMKTARTNLDISSIKK